MCRKKNGFSKLSLFTPWRLFFHWAAFYFVVVASEKSNFLIVMDETFDYAKDQMFSNI
jgi:hypothetical protein